MSSSGKAVVTLPSDTQILITREFDAPKHLVYRAWTEPALVRRWWAGERGTVTSLEIDLRVGGSWRFVMTANEGFAVGFHGEYLEIVPGERIVSTEIYEDVPDASATNRITLEERDGTTTMRILVEHERPEHRDAHIDLMEGGMQEAMDALEEVAQSLATQPVG